MASVECAKFWLLLFSFSFACAYVMSNKLLHVYTSKMRKDQIKMRKSTENKVRKSLFLVISNGSVAGERTMKEGDET